jgi:formamidopyrimidine-DNA glycosylase
MPEGVEVRWTTKCLKRHIEGLDLIQIVEYSQKSIKNNSLFKKPIGCTEVACVGKVLYIKLDGASDKLYLTIQFGLTGYLSLEKDKQYLRYSFLFGDLIVYYYDRINYGHLELLKPVDFFVKINKLGLDIFNPEDFNIHSLNTLMDLKGDSNICVFLMDQHILAGIGNYAKSEILYHANLSPMRKVKSLSSNERKELYGSICFVVYSIYLAGFAENREGVYYNIFTNLDCRIENIVMIDLELSRIIKAPSRYRIQVYNKTTDLFGNPVEKLETDDKRTTYWVQELQR